MEALDRTRKKAAPRAQRAQAIVEFAIVLPILLMLLVGVLEVGRMVFIYAAVNNASREAVRFASAVGFDDDGLRHYNNCAGITEVAQRSALVQVNTTIRYDSGPGTTLRSPVCDGSDTVNSGDRVVVEVRTLYSPLIKLIPISPRMVTSSSARTILGIFDLESGLGSVPSGGGGGGGGRGGGGGGGTSNTPTATATPTATNTPTATATGIGPYTTPTLFDTPTVGTPVTPTDTVTPTATFTPTATSTPVPGCNRIVASNINVSGSSMRITIRNPHDALTVSNIVVRWNHDTGGSGAKPALTLQSVLLEIETWTVLEDGPSATIVPSPAMVIPGNNTTSVLSFAFNKGYQNLDGTEAITVNFSTAGCELYSIQRPAPTSTPTSVPTLPPTLTPTSTPSP